MSNTQMAKKSKGRQKIEMTRMSKESNLLVTFSKRRSGIFKKASELCTLCGAEIAIVVFSPGKKAFSFGHPSVEAIAEKFFYNNSIYGGSSSSSSATSKTIEAHRNATVLRLNLQLTEAMNLLEAEKKRGDELDKKPNHERGWWESSVDELAIEQLQQLKVAMEALNKDVTKQIEKLQMLEPPNLHYTTSSAASFYATAGAAPNTSHNGTAVPISDNEVSGLGLSMAPLGHAHGFGLSYGYGNRHERGFY